LFVPLLIGTGGNTGAQATTVVIRAMSLGEVRIADLPRVVWREARVGLILGAMLALVGFGPVALFLSIDMAWVVSLTLLAICTWATFTGSMMPLLADRVGIDPAVVSPGLCLASEPPSASLAGRSRMVLIPSPDRSDRVPSMPSASTQQHPNSEAR
jgi:magnesium transporter